MSAPVEASMAALRRLSVASWRYFVSTRNSLASRERESKFRLCSCKYCVATASQLQRCHDSVVEFGRKDGVECESASGLSHGRSATTSLAWRNCHTVSPTFSSLLGRNFNEGGGLPGLVLHSRHLAVKAKKTKSKVENVESIEDVAGTAKGNAVRMMETALDILSREHSKLRTGRASAGMLDHITVEAHGVRTPLSHLAAVTVSGLQTLNVLPYDASIVKEVEKAILNSPMGLNPQVDGATMTVPLPRLTKEHCETMCKLVSKAGESAKLTIRRARKEALDVVKNSGDLSKDEMKRFEKDVEELTKKYTKSIDETCKNKEKEIMA